jgi:uncharacterized protein
MRVGITGSSGLIGTALVKELRSRGDQVVIFSRNTHSAGNDVIRWNPAEGTINRDDLDKVGHFDAVVHLAGAGIGDKRWSHGRKNEILWSRTKSTQLLAKELVGGVSTFACGSAIGYYGSRDNERLNEESTHGDGFLSEVCVEWEKAAEPLRGAGVALSYLRTGIVQSEDGGALAKQLPLFKLGLGGKLGSGKQWLSPISLQDEVRAIIWIVDNKMTGPFNLVAPEPLTNSDFTKELARFLHRPAFASAPEIALKMALGTELAESLLLASQRVVPTRLLESGFSFHSPNFQAILKEVVHLR